MDYTEKTNLDLQTEWDWKKGSLFIPLIPTKAADAQDNIINHITDPGLY